MSSSNMQLEGNTTVTFCFDWGKPAWQTFCQPFGLEIFIELFIFKCWHHREWFHHSTHL